MKKKIGQLLFYFLLPLLISCNRDFEPIDYGRDVCANCKMTIVDNRFAAELIDKKGRAFKFDDLLCLKHFISNQPDKEIRLLFIEDYLNRQEEPLNALTVVYLQHQFFKSPMNGNYAAFKSEEEALHFKDSLGISILSWDNLK